MPVGNPSTIAAPSPPQISTANSPHSVPPDLHAFSAAGKRLMELHIDYEKQPEYPLEQIEDPKAEVTFRVERMKLCKDKPS
jgi:predicted helicase